LLRLLPALDTFLLLSPPALYRGKELGGHRREIRFPGGFPHHDGRSGPRRKRRRGNPGRWCSAEWTRAPPGEPLPGIRGRCATSPSWTAEPLPPASGPSPHRIRLLLAADRDGETLPTLRASSGYDLSARRCRHATTESVGSQSPPVMRLVGTLHPVPLLPRVERVSLETK
jgi:hypothetical protein